MNPNNGAIVIPRRAQGLIVLCAGLVAGLMLLPVSDRFVFSAMSIAAYVIGLLNGWHFGKDRR